MKATHELPQMEAPWMAGQRAARANLVSALIVQSIMLILVLGYYFYPPTTRWLDQLAELKMRWGYGYSALAAAIAGGLIPEVMRIVFLQRARVMRSNFSNLIFTIPFWSCTGMMVDLLLAAIGAPDPASRPRARDVGDALHLDQRTSFRDLKVTRRACAHV